MNTNKFLQNKTLKFLHHVDHRMTLIPLPHSRQC